MGLVPVEALAVCLHGPWFGSTRMYEPARAATGHLRRAWSRLLRLSMSAPRTRLGLLLRAWASSGDDLGSIGGVGEIADHFPVGPLLGEEGIGGGAAGRGFGDGGRGKGAKSNAQAFNESE